MKSQQATSSSAYLTCRELCYRVVCYCAFAHWYLHDNAAIQSFSCHWIAPKTKFSLCWIHLHPSTLPVACPRKCDRYQYSSPVNHWNVLIQVLLDVACTFHNLLNHMASFTHASKMTSTITFCIKVHMQWLQHVAWVGTCILMDVQWVN
jgi:hypothetical protein